ncbi:MAG: MarR family transcriptional regulator [Thermoplasmata archaeon]
MPPSRARSRTDPPSGEVWPALWELFGAFGPELRRIAHSAGITLPQLAMLKACERGPVSATELARRSDRTAPAITYVTREMEAAGLLRRVPSTRDRRRVGFSLTSKGRSTLGRIHAEGGRWDRDRSSSFSGEDWRSLARAIGILAHRVESHTAARDETPPHRTAHRPR